MYNSHRNLRWESKKRSLGVEFSQYIIIKSQFVLEKKHRCQKETFS